MYISNLSFTQNLGYSTLSASVKFDKSKDELLYFTFPQQKNTQSNFDYSPFLAAVLLPCMKTGEDIYIDGSVSKKLLVNTRKIMSLVVSWKIGLKKIKIVSKTTSYQISSQNKNVAAFFSGGVDSFYTYLKNKKIINDLILVHGFDVPLENTQLFNKIKNNLSTVAKKERKKLLIVKTNVAQIVEKKLIWDFSHGGALAAVGLLFQDIFKSVFISSAVRKDKLFPYGTHPELDKLWSTETINFYHVGSEHSRLEKVMKLVSKSDLALSHLHVCAQNLKGKYNCSKCFKCLMTMIELICANVLQKSKTFDKKINLNLVRNMYYDYTLLYNVLGEANLSELKKQNREYELQNAIQESLRKSKKPSKIKKLTSTAASLDQKYNNRRIYTWLFKTNKEGDRSVLFKLLLQKGVFK